MKQLSTTTNPLCLASIGGVLKVNFYVVRLALQIYVHFRFCGYYFSYDLIWVRYEGCKTLKGDFGWTCRERTAPEFGQTW